MQSNLERFSRIFAVLRARLRADSGAKCEPSWSLHRSDEMTWTRVAVTADGSAGGTALFYVCNARDLVDVPPQDAVVSRES